MLVLKGKEGPFGVHVESFFNIALRLEAIRGCTL